MLCRERTCKIMALDLYHLCIVCDSEVIAMSFSDQPDRSVEVCREFMRQRCERENDTCRFAHPPSHCNIINGRVTCCVDSIKV